MAKEEESKKRKASVPQSGAEKIKKVPAEAAVAPEKKRKATEEAAPAAVKKSKTPKPTLEKASKPKPPTSSKDAKPPKNTNDDTSKRASSAAKKLKPTKKSKEQDVGDFPSDIEDANEGSEGEDEDSEIDDQTEALLKGFESDGDEEDAVKEDGLKEGEKVPTVPDLSNRSKKQLQRATDFKKDDSPGVIYVGRIPHGFYEHEMRDYFKQFGTITKLRLSRNRQTGSSKHVAWIQFESSAVAEIVAKTMDNYLLFNHILKVKLVPNEQVPASLWKGANKRFKKVPWNKMAGRELAQPKSEDAWDKQSARVQARRKEKADKLKELMDYEFDAPEPKSSKGLAQKAQPALSNQDDEITAIEAAPIEKELKKKGKKDKKQAAKAVQDVTAPDGSTAAPETEIATIESKKALKPKESKSDLVEVAEGEGTKEAKVKKPKKSKKVKTDA
ncbi:putative RNA-binding [Hyphodiscus hymeniophilus]|uniref:RNA-binding n=1 Tax=Hyphodiscus hymeniophilus TaxID=353542 RepID=A0A9P6VPU7_9HELO|nr:putative RNA-binding [Hyphodiscus hymeniophilus]